MAYQTKDLRPCCRKAIVEYWTEKEDEIPPAPKDKIKTEITEITDGKL